MAAALRSSACISSRILSSKRSFLLTGMKFISTSGKKGETPAITEQPSAEQIKKRYGLYDKSSDPKEPENRDWISYGFSLNNEAEDRWAMNLLGISTISILFVGGAFILAYMPDLDAVDWSRREAYLELHRREKLGLPLISKDYVDPSKFNLPSDEEIGDFEIML